MNPTNMLGAGLNPAKPAVNPALHAKQDADRLAPKASGAGGVFTLLMTHWRSPQARLSILLLAVLVVLALGEVYAQYLVSDWQRLLFNAFQSLDRPAFWQQITDGLLVITLFVGFQAAKLYVLQGLAIRWRRWLTDQLLGRWLATGSSGSAFYELERTGAVDNPDQRIAEDVRLWVELTVEFAIGLLFALALFASFAAVLWRVSGEVTMNVGDLSWTVHGHLFWIALAYVLLGNLITHLVGRKLIPTNQAQQHAEADFRYALTRARENAESIALARGVAGERRGMDSRFAVIRSNWFRLMRLRLGLSVTSGWYEQFSTLLAYLVAAPRLFTGEITLGDMVQAATAFGVVRQALSWFITNYARVADWKACANRLVHLDAELTRVSQPRALGITVQDHAGAALTTEALVLGRPGGPRALIEPLTWSVQPGERWMISGPSGIGKTTLLRALAGIWPDGAGSVLRPAAARVMLVPQKPYLPLGHLREMLCMPHDPKHFDDATLREVLTAVRLAALADELDSDVSWHLRLSPGEAQRLAFARLLLQKPDLVFLDEATSALDAQTEQHLYALLIERLPQATLVSVAHRSALKVFHPAHLHFECDPGSQTARARSLHLSEADQQHV